LSGVASLRVTNTASDLDSPSNGLTYQLAQAPTGAAIDTNGVITWTPAVVQVPSTNLFVTVVTDSNPWAVNEQHFSTSNSFLVVVSAVHNQINRPPMLPIVPDKILIGQQSLTVYNTAVDIDLPPNPLTYQLLSAPTGAAIDTSGVITWTPSESQVPSTNVFETRVTDYNPWAMNDQHLSTENAFMVIVGMPGSVLIESVTVNNGLATITWSSVAGKTYRLQYKGNLTGESWHDISPDVTATGATTSATDAVSESSERYYRVFVP
jgi:hypothetical protein